MEIYINYKKQNMNLILKFSKQECRKRLAEYAIVVACVCIVLLLLRVDDIKMKILQLEHRLSSMDLQASDQKSKSELVHLYNQYKNSNQLRLLDLNLLNNTRHAGVQMVFFNRVPKVGSQSFNELLLRLSKRNNFHFYSKNAHQLEMVGFTISQQQEYADMLSDAKTPSAYSQHMCFVNFTKFNRASPIYVNLVREPIARIHSWFYYVRQPWYYALHLKNHPLEPIPTAKFFLKDFDTCFLEGNDPECTFSEGDTSNDIKDHRRQTVWFCGHDPECMPFNTQDVLQRSKHAVETQFSVVGVLEDMKTTLAVFEKYIPRFFAGASEIYFSDMKEFREINKNNFKPPLSDEAKQLLRKNFTREIEFYEFCKRRLQTQYLAANLNDFE